MVEEDQSKGSGTFLLTLLALLALRELVVPLVVLVLLALLVAVVVKHPREEEPPQVLARARSPC